jgi:8-oxo-dGTP diphosphatase
MVDVAAAVIKREDRYLLCQRPLEKRHGGLFELPGGKCRQNESLSECMRRELLEELGIASASVKGIRGSLLDIGSEFLITFLDVDIEGEPAPLEHAALLWATISEALSLPLAPTDRSFLESIDQGRHA